MKNLIRLLAIASVAAGLSLGVMANASAHAELDTSDPADGAVLANSPATVSLHFIEAIQHVAGSYDVDVHNALGESVRAGSPVIGSDSMSLSVALKPNLPDGVYTVVWSNLSEDGDALTDEQFTFTVNTGVAPTSPAPAATPGSHTHTDETTPATSAGAVAPTVSQIVVAASEQNGSGVSGRAEIVPVSGGSMAQVSVFLSGLAPNSSHMAHIHVASTCFEGPHAADLEDIVASSAGFGKSVTTIDLPFSTLADGNHNILVHAGADALVASDQHVIACAVIPAQPAGGAALAHPAALPSTGSAGDANGSAILVSIVALALAGTMIAAGGAFAARRRG